MVQQISTLRDIVVSPPETLRVLQPHRWVAADFSDKDKLDAADSADRAKYQEPSDRAIFLARTVSVQESMDHLSETDNQGHRPYAAVITEHGKVNETPLWLVAPADLPVLMDALEWE